VAKYNPDYLRYVEGERERLGEDHPLFMTQYRLLPIHGGGGFLSAVQKAQLQGGHERRRLPEPGKIYIAGIDLAGEEETDQQDLIRNMRQQRDAVLLTIGEATPVKDYASRAKTVNIKVVEHYTWVGKKHPELYPQLIDLLKTWRCARTVVDATGIGEPAASFLRQALGHRIIPFKFTAQSKSELGFNLLAAVNSGNLKMYAGDNSAEYQEFWRQMERARGHYRASRTMNFYVDPNEGHDDYLMSLALLVEAARNYEPREAKGR